MSLEIGSQVASILSAFFALIALIGIGMTYKIITKQSSKNNIFVNGDAVIKDSFNTSSQVKPPKNNK